MQSFSILPDPRTGSEQLHDLQKMIVMALSSVLCGADTWVDVAEWAGDNEYWLKKHLVLKNGTPDQSLAGLGLLQEVLSEERVIAELLPLASSP